MSLIYNRDDFNEDEDDSAFLPADASGSHLLLTKEMPLHRRLLPGSSPAAVQRRATVSGASPTVSKPPINIEDLVNGVPRIKNSDTYGRSISHDPACHKLSVKQDSDGLNETKSNAKRDAGDGISDENAKDTDESSSKTTSDINHTSETTEEAREGELCSSEKSTRPMMEALPVQEECTVLENKSLNKSDDCIIIQNDSPSETFGSDIGSNEVKSSENKYRDSLSSISKSSASSTGNIFNQ